MYSMVVMMAMSTSPEAVACGKHMSHGTGCYGSSCTGVVYTGCTGAYSGCTGTVYSGCTGSYSGCSGCHGGHKLFGGLGGGMFGKHKHGCSGCYGSTPVYTGCTGGGCTGVIIDGTMSPPPVVVPPPKKDMPKEPKATSIPATITLNVPADAKVTIDGAATTSTSSVRVFSTPALEVGNVYSYTIAAEVVRNGKVISTSKVVAVTPGETAKVELNPETVTTIVAR